MNEKPSNRQENNISDTSIGGKIKLDNFIELSGLVKYKSSKFKIKPNNSYFVKLDNNDFAIIRVFCDGSIKFIIYADNEIIKGEL